MEEAEEAYQNHSRSEVSEVNLLMKVQTAPKDWDEAPCELIELRMLLQRTGYQFSWSPQKLGINLLTANKIRGMVMKRILMKLYPFDSFWCTDTLDETLHKCLLACQQLGMEARRSVIWGQCSMDASFNFWKYLLKTAPRVSKTRSDESMAQEAKSKLVTALLASRGTDWDKAIATNFEEGIEKLRSSVHHRKSSCRNNPILKQIPKSRFTFSNNNNCEGPWKNSVPRHVATGATNEEEPSPSPEELKAKLLAKTTTSLAIELKQESQDVIKLLKSIEKYYVDDCVLQIESAFKLGHKVCELAEDFESYMASNNRGAFKDVDSLTNHTDRVIKAMSKLTSTFQEFFLEFQKYFDGGWGSPLYANAAQNQQSGDGLLRHT